MGTSCGFLGPDWLADTGRWPTWEHQTTAALYTPSSDNCDGYELQPTVSTSPVTNTITGIHNVIDVTRYRKLRKLLRITAFILRFARNCRTHKSTCRIEHLTASELQEAEQLWIKSCQHCICSEEIKSMRFKLKENRLPLVKQLRLFIDGAGDIRCGGRIHNAPICEDAKFPYLLPQKHPFTRLVVLDAHERLLHSGSSSTITYLRQKCWIPVIRRCVQSVLRKCVVCRKVNGKSYPAPDPPPLPRIRVEDSHPFTVTGVNFTDALYVREKKVRKPKHTFVCSPVLRHELSTWNWYLIFLQGHSYKRSVDSVAGSPYRV